MVREAISKDGKQLPRSRKETCSIHLIHRCTPCGNKICNPNTPTSWQAPELTQARFDQHDGRIVSSTKLVTESSINSSGRPTMTHTLIGYGYATKNGGSDARRKNVAGKTVTSPPFCK